MLRTLSLSKGSREIEIMLIQFFENLRFDYAQRADKIQNYAKDLSGMQQNI